MDRRDIIVIGASAGGIQPLFQIVSTFPALLPAAVFVVVHQTAFSHTLSLFRRKECALPAHYASDGESITPGNIYLAPADRHLLVGRGRVRVQLSPRQLWLRPAIDSLFRSAAAAYGSRVAAVVLSGSMGDGTAGLWEVKNRGGLTIVQDPREAEHPQMVESAIENVAIDHCLPSAKIGPLLTELACRQPASSPRENPQRTRILIVEDQRIVARNLANRLRDFNYEIIGSVGSGEEAVEAAKSLPDLALMDIRLSGRMDGIEAARILWERFQIPVVYITGHGDADTIEQLKSTQPYGYVGKPLRPADVHAAIQLALHRRDTELSGF